jgi:hypothetical protein
MESLRGWRDSRHPLAYEFGHGAKRADEKARPRQNPQI